MALRAYGLKRFFALALAIALPLVIVLLRVAFQRKLGPHPLLILFIPAIIVPALVGGWWPGIVATAVAAACSNFYLIMPTRSIQIQEGGLGLAWFVMIASGVLVSLLSEYQHRARAGLRNALERIRQADQRFEVILDNITDHAVVTLDPGGHVVTWNAGAQRLMGYARDEIVGRPMHVFYPLDEVEAGWPAAQLSVARDEGRVEDSGWRFSKNGTRFYAEVVIYAMHDDEGQLTGFAKITRDVTERMLSQKANEALIDTIRDQFIMSVTDRDGNLVEVNDAFCAISQHSRAELLGANHRLVKSGHHSSAFYETVWQSISSGRSWRGEFCNRARDGSVYWVDSVIAPLRDANGQIDRYVSIRSDITSRKRTEMALRELNGSLDQRVAERTKQLETARNEAERLARVKSEFLANMSHEIRTPMNAVLGMTGLLKRTGATREQRDFLDKIDTAGRHLVGIIDTILDLSKIEAGKLRLDEADFPFGDLVRDVAAVVGDRATAKGLKIRIDAGGVPAWLHGDRARLAQALINYMGNAVKFTEAGSVGLGCRVLEEDARGCLLRFEVSDTGVGMSREEQARIFQPFEQADNSATRRFQGTGLGLAITKRIADLMGAQVGVCSEPGKGSAFWLTVYLLKGAAPAGDAASHRSDDAETRLRREFNGVRILLVEDDPVSREVAQLLLQGAGLDVEVAENGRIAVQKAASGEFALILTDMQMPEMDGLQAARAIRAGGRATPILALTANAFDDDRRKCAEAGMNDFIVKPVEPMRLFETVLKWLLERGEMRSIA